MQSGYVPYIFALCTTTQIRELDGSRVFDYPFITTNSTDIFRSWSTRLTVIRAEAANERRWAVAVVVGVIFPCDIFASYTHLRYGECVVIAFEDFFHEEMVPNEKFFEK